MFSGIVQAIGRIAQREPRGGDLRLVIDAAALDTGAIALGDSIAVAGVCLTVVAIDAARLAFDLSNETLARTALGALQVGDGVNLERALRMGDRLDGHLVSGHVDGLGRVATIEPDARSQRWTFEAPAALMRYIAPKGSICVDGTSLTVNGVEGTRFDVNLIPHTLAVTTFGAKAVDAPVHLEIDLIARYVARLLQA